jgi:hypothetical protein
MLCTKEMGKKLNGILFFIKENFNRRQREGKIKLKKKSNRESNNQFLFSVYLKKKY